MAEYTTREQDQIERETSGFDARTLIDDTIGQLTHVRGLLFMDVPDGLLDLLRCSEELAGKIIELTEDLPAAPEQDGGSLRKSGSKCLYEACSCGMPAWLW